MVKYEVPASWTYSLVLVAFGLGTHANTPWLEPGVNVRFVGAGTLSAGAAAIVRLTGIVCGVFVAPDAEIVILVVYVPGFKLPIFTVPVTVPEPEPLAGLRLSQLAGSDTLQFNIPVP